MTHKEGGVISFTRDEAFLVILLFFPALILFCVYLYILIYYIYNSVNKQSHKSEILFIFFTQVLPSWKTTISGSISLKFRTNELHGLLLFNAGGSPGKVSRKKLLFSKKIIKKISPLDDSCINNYVGNAFMYILYL